jgi:hypothetical protein
MNYGRHQMSRMLADGMGISEIANDLGVTTVAVKRALARLGLQAPPFAGLDHCGKGHVAILADGRCGDCIRERREKSNDRIRAKKRKLDNSKSDAKALAQKADDGSLACPGGHDDPDRFYVKTKKLTGGEVATYYYCRICRGLDRKKTERTQSAGITSEVASSRILLLGDALNRSPTPWERKAILEQIEALKPFVKN